MVYYNSVMSVNPSSDALTIPIHIDRGSAVPIGVQLSERLAWLIATRAFAPGDPLPSIRALASFLGIHHHTVREVYNDLQADGLVSVRHGAGITVKEVSALQLARVRAIRGVSTIGVLIAGFDPFYLPFLRGVEHSAVEARLLPIASVTEDSPVKARLKIGQLIASGVGGIIAASVGQVTRSELRGEGQRSIVPVVYCDQPDQVKESIVFDAPAAGYELAIHLAGHGHQRITLVAPALDMPNVGMLASGYERAVAEGRISGIDFVSSDGFGVDAGSRAAAQVMRAVPRPTAVATASDELAIGVLAAARDLGLRVPDDLAIVSYGEIEAARFVRPPITTVALPAEEMGALAARRLVARMRGEPPLGSTLMTGLVVVRDSCGKH